MSSTLKDIAEKLNISVSTVSRVANNKNYVSPKTRRKVLKALEEMNYSPNQVARSLKKKSTNTIGIVVPDISEVFFANVIKGIDGVLSNNGYSIILCDTDEKPEKEELYLNLLMEKQIDGIILATVSKKHVTLQRIIGKGLPVIFIDNLPNIKKGYDSVIIDNSKANPVDAIDIYKGEIRSIHVKDGEYPTDGHNLGKEKPVGEGRVNFPELIKKLQSYGYKGPYIIEREISGPQQRIDIIKARDFLLKVLSKGN
jgi:transcriptional regulator with XRE-family HTH domain